MLRTFSKAHALASLRVGRTVGPPAIIATLNATRDPFNTNSIGIAAALASLEDEAWLADAVAWNAEVRGRLANALRWIGLTVVPSEANFLLVPLDRPADPVADALLHHGIIVRTATASGLPDALRITVGLPDENRLLIEALVAVLGGVPC